MLRTRSWPKSWKVDTLVVIPKKRSPESLSECRNLSSTRLFSKAFEKLVFDRINAEGKLSDSQYGGRKTIGVDHMLVDMWHSIINDLEHESASSCLISLDFEKAFNQSTGRSWC